MASVCIQTSQWTIDNVICTSRGSKVAKLRGSSGNFCTFTPKNYLRVPFEPSVFDKDPTAQRLNLVLECDCELHEEIAAFDAWIVKYIAENSERILKRSMSIEQVRAGYSSCLKAAPAGKNFNQTLKTKIDVGGNGAVRCWSAVDGAAVDVPSEWRVFKVKPLLHFSHLWIMGAQFGVVIKVTDVEIGEDLAAAPVVTNPVK